MPKPDGYILSEETVNLFRKFLYTYGRQQHYVNAFGRGPDNKIDHEEMHTTEVYIARTPSDGIPALQSMGSTGIGDIPGSAVCTVFKRKQGTTTTEDVTGFQQTVLNLSATAIDGNSWILITRDKFGDWYAMVADANGDGAGGQSTGPGWTAGLSNEDCLLLTVTAKVGKCSTIPNQSITLVSEDGVTWEGLDDFIYSGGTDIVQFSRPCPGALPVLTIGVFCLIWDAAGIDDNGDYYIEYKGGTALCSDVEGTGSGTGGARGVCGSNTFTVRLTCTDCPGPLDPVACLNKDFDADGATVTVTDKVGGATCLDTTPVIQTASTDLVTWEDAGCGGFGFMGPRTFACFDGFYTLPSGTGETWTLVSFTTVPWAMTWVVEFDALSPIGIGSCVVTLSSP